MISNIITSDNTHTSSRYFSDDNVIHNTRLRSSDVLGELSEQSLLKIEVPKSVLQRSLRVRVGYGASSGSGGKERCPESTMVPVHEPPWLPVVQEQLQKDAGGTATFLVPC